MTSSVDRKQYDWKAEPQRSFFNTASVGHRDAGDLDQSTTLFDPLVKHFI